MANQKSLYRAVLELWAHVGQRRRFQIYALILLYVLAALAEAVSLATLIPFLALLIEPTKFDAYLPAVISGVLPSDRYRIIYIACIYLFLVIFAGVIRLLTLWANNRISFMLGADISREIYARTLNQPYSFFLGKNSSQLVDIMTKKSDALISGAIIPVLQCIGAIAYIVILVSILILISPYTTIFLAISLTFAYFIVSFLTKKKAVKNGLLISKGSSGLIKSIQEAMQSKKDLILNRSQDYFVVRYHEADIRLRLAESENQFLLHSPKIIFELMAIVLMVVLAISFQTMSVKSASYIPVLAAFALGAQRLLPSLQQIYAALSNIHARSSMLYEVVEVLSLGSESNLSIRDKIIVFDHTLRFENIYYQYPGVKINALTNVNFTLKKGDRIGIQGPSGGGKSTFINLLLGLIEPSKGAIYCDNLECASLTNTSWYAQVSHVPQDVPILDATLLENIAYGLRIEDINVDQARHAADMAKILRDVDLMDQGFMTLVGESGERLSGGQKQRIGIARALYKNAKVLILDEFTSALDNQTELEIVETIRSLPESITIVTIAHRAQALSICSRLIKIEEGNLSSMS